MVSEADRRKMRSIGRDLADSEIDDRGTHERRREFLDVVNAARRRAGRAALDDRPPEEGLYERARALGMARIDR